MRQIWDRRKMVAEIDLVDGELRVENVDGNWVRGLLEEMRQGMTDQELWDSLPARLTGHIWIAEVKDSARRRGAHD